MQPSRGCIVKDRHARANSAEGGTGADARPSGSRTAGRPSAPPGRGQAAKAVFRRGGMSRIRRMRGPPQAGRETRRQARTTQERPNAPAPTARDSAPASRRTGAERAGSRCGRSRSQSGDWREMRRRKRSFRREAAQIAQQSSARAKRSGRKEPRGTGADARPSGSRTALSARSERLGRNHAHVREERRRWMVSCAPMPHPRLRQRGRLPTRARF